MITSDMNKLNSSLLVDKYTKIVENCTVSKTTLYFYRTDLNDDREDVVFAHEANPERKVVLVHLHCFLDLPCSGERERQQVTSPVEMPC